jgi:hypothetical protein
MQKLYLNTSNLLCTNSLHIKCQIYVNNITQYKKAEF